MAVPVACRRFMSDPASRNRRALHEWVLVFLLAGNLWWTTLCLGGYRPETLVPTALLNGSLLAVYLIAVIAGMPVGRSAMGWAFVPFLVYAATNVLWVTSVRWLGWRDWLVWAQMGLVFWVALNGVRGAPQRAALRLSLMALGMVAVALGSYQRLVDPDWMMLGRIQAQQFIGRASGPFGIPNSLAALLLLLFPPAFATAIHRGRSAFLRSIAALVAAVLLVGLFLTISRGGWIALALSCALWPLFLPGRTWMRRIGASAAIVLVFAATFGALYVSVPRVKERIDFLVQYRGEVVRPILWRASLAMFREHPLVGTGAGSFNVEIEKHRPEGFRDEPQWAHNEYLNTLSDYGAIGFVLFFGTSLVVAIRGLKSIARRDRDKVIAGGPIAWVDDPRIAVGWGVGLLAFAMQLFVDFHFKIPALAMLFAVIAGQLAGGTNGAAATVPSGMRRSWAGAALLGLVAFVPLFVLPYYRAEAARYGPRREIDASAERPLPDDERRALIERSRLSFVHSTELDPSNAQAWADRSYADSLWALEEPDQTQELGKEAEASARRAVALSPAVFEFWIRLGVGLDMQGRWLEAGDAFTEALKLAPMNSLAWYYLAFHQSLNITTRRVAQATIATSLRLDPGNRTAEALRRSLATGQ